jgi:hypothetical protein
MDDSLTHDMLLSQAFEGNDEPTADLACQVHFPEFPGTNFVAYVKVAERKGGLRNFHCFNLYWERFLLRVTQELEVQVEWLEQDRGRLVPLGV